VSRATGVSRSAMRLMRDDEPDCATPGGPKKSTAERGWTAPPLIFFVCDIVDRGDHEPHR
jgi:hypothetical protein